MTHMNTQRRLFQYITTCKNGEMKHQGTLITAKTMYYTHTVHEKEACTQHLPVWPGCICLLLSSRWNGSIDHHACPLRAPPNHNHSSSPSPSSPAHINTGTQPRAHSAKLRRSEVVIAAGMKAVMRPRKAELVSTSNAGTIGSVRMYSFFHSSCWLI